MNDFDKLMKKFNIKWENKEGEMDELVTIKSIEEKGKKMYKVDASVTDLSKVCEYILNLEERIKKLEDKNK